MSPILFSSVGGALLVPVFGIQLITADPIVTTIVHSTFAALIFVVVTRIDALAAESEQCRLWDPNLTWLPIAPLMLVKESSDLALKLSCVVEIAHRNGVFKKFTLDSRR
jgi:hypothetical protein